MAEEAISLVSNNLPHRSMPRAFGSTTLYLPFSVVVEKNKLPYYCFLSGSCRWYVILIIRHSPDLSSLRVGYFVTEALVHGWRALGKI